MITPKKPPLSGKGKVPPKQTSKPAGGKLPLGGTKKGALKGPNDGSQDVR